MSPPDQPTGYPNQLDGPVLRVAAAVGLLILLLGVLGRWSDPDPTSVPIVSSEGRPYYLLLLVLSVLAGLLAHYVVGRGSSAISPAQVLSSMARTSTSWTPAVVTVFGAGLFLANFHRLVVLLTAPVAAGILVYLAITWYSESAQFSLFKADKVALIGVIPILLIALLAFSMTYFYKVRTLYSAPVIFVLGLLLMLSLLNSEEAPPARKYLYAAAGGLLVAEALWALNYWNAAAWQAGGLLTILYLVAASLMTVQLNGGIDRRDLVEHAALSVSVLAVLVILVGRR